MENYKVIQLGNKKPQSKGLILAPEEKKRLTDFFSILIEIDQRVRKEKKYENIRNTDSAN